MINSIEELKQIQSKTKEYICLDIETTGLRPWYGDRITCICAKTSKGEKFICVDPDEINILWNFFRWLETLPKFDDEYFFLTKNGKDFDIPFIMSRISFNEDFHKVPAHMFLNYCEHFDLQDITSKRISLQQMAELYNCTPKSGTGENAIKLWNEKRYDELKAYCMQDVNTTIEVFETWKKLHKI